MAPQVDVEMQVPETPPTEQVTGGVPLELLPELAALERGELLEPELDERALGLEVDGVGELGELLELEELELLPVGVQHSMLAGPGQRPGVALWPGIALHVEVSMQVPGTPATEQSLVLPPPPLPPCPPAKARRSESDPLNLSRSR